MKEEEIKEILLENNEEFQKVHREHQECEKALAALQAKSFLSEEERVQEKFLKKKKLRLKDEMYRMILEFERQGKGNE